jgi:hypothetical protein
LCSLRGFDHYLQVREPVFSSDSSASIVVRVFSNVNGVALPERQVLYFQRRSRQQWVHVAVGQLPVW